MLKGDSVLLKRLQYLSAETDLGVHHIFFNIHRAEAFFTGDTGDDIFGLLAGASHDPGTVVFRRIGVSDIDGNTLLTYREDGILMKDAGTHVSQFTQFFVGDGLDRNRIFHDARVGYQETGYIGPVLVEVCVNRAGYDGASDKVWIVPSGLDP